MPATAHNIHTTLTINLKDGREIVDVEGAAREPVSRVGCGRANDRRAGCQGRRLVQPRHCDGPEMSTATITLGADLTRMRMRGNRQARDLFEVSAFAPPSIGGGLECNVPHTFLRSDFNAPVGLIVLEYDVCSGDKAFHLGLGLKFVERRAEVCDERTKVERLFWIYRFQGRNDLSINAPIVALCRFLNPRFEISRYPQPKVWVVFSHDALCVIFFLTAMTHCALTLMTHYAS